MKEHACESLPADTRIYLGSDSQWYLELTEPGIAQAGVRIVAVTKTIRRYIFFCPICGQGL